MFYVGVKLGFTIKEDYRLRMFGNWELK